VRYDFRHRLGLALEDVGGRVTFGEAIDLVDQLIREAGTHTHASVNGWSFPMTNAERSAQIHALAFLNVHRDVKKHPKPFELPWPWPERDAVTDDERKSLTAQLDRRSALRDR
jgi:hypothetical protein